MRRFLSHGKDNARAATETAKKLINVLEVEKGIYHVQLNRPEKMNALSLEMFETITSTAVSLRENSTIRAVILSGNGKAFCTGLDIKSVGVNPLNFPKLLNKPGRTTHSNLAQDVAYIWRQLPFPVIASLHGMCFGGGLQIAMGADFRISTPDCQFSVMEAKWGLIPDMSASVTFREQVRLDIIKELTMTARIFSGTQAQSYGFVTRSLFLKSHTYSDRCDENPFERSLDLAREIASRSPDSVAATKRLFQETWVSGEGEALDKETELQKKLLKSWNTISASGRSMGFTSLPYTTPSDLNNK